MKVLLTLVVVCGLLYVAAGSCVSCMLSQPSASITTKGSMTDIAYDTDGNKVYVAYYGNDVVDIFNRDGSKHGTIDLEFNTWGDLTSIDIHKGVLYGSMQNRVYVRSADLVTKQTNVVFGPSQGFGNNNIIVNDNGVYVVNYVHNAVIQYDFSGQEIKRFTRSGLQYPQDAAFDSKGNLHVVGTYNNEVYVFDASGNEISSYSNTHFLEPFGIYIDTVDNSFVANQRGGGIFAFDSAGNYVREFATLPKKADEVVLLPDCELWGAAGGNKTIMIYK